MARQVRRRLSIHPPGRGTERLNPGLNAREKLTPLVPKVHVIAA